MRTIAPLYLLSSLAILPQLSACKPRQKAAPSTVAPSAKATAPAKPSPRPLLSTSSEIGKEVLATMDPNADPCQDFYRYACGGWLDKTQLPADKPRYGRGFGVVRDRNAKALRGLLEKAPSAPGERAKIGQFYQACMDEAAIEAQSTAPLNPLLHDIDKVKNVKDLMKLLGRHQGRALPSAFAWVGLENDYKEPDLYILGVGQASLGLGERSYYLEAAQKPVLDAYRAHIERMMATLGAKPLKASQIAQDIIALETELAKISKSRQDLRDPEKVYHPMSQKEFEALAPKLPLGELLSASGIGKVERINVTVPSFFQELPQVLNQTKPETWRDYLRFRAITFNAPLLSKAVFDADFVFRAHLRGTKQPLPRWERCVKATTRAYPDLVAQAYVEAKFPGESKQIALTMIQDIERAFESKLVDLAWMDDGTRARAVEKMRAVGNKIGYPDKWRTYTEIRADQGLFANAMASRELEHAKDLQKLGTRVDKAKWRAPASMVNAFYNSLQNEIVFPAGILQPPYFSREFPRAMNYGAMGMVMGHELTHGFDDSGRKFDGQGVMRQWWDPSASKRFETQAQCIDDAFSKEQVQPGVHINGKLTLGENIADFGGIKFAFYGYKEWVKAHGQEPALIKGLSNDQLFFVAFAQGWCSKSSPEFDRRMIVVDPHSPPKQRVNLPLGHFPEFWTTFACQESTPMHVSNACQVW